MKTDKQQKASGKVVKIGLKQLDNETPQWAKWIFRIILYVSALYAAAIQPNLNIPTEVQLQINQILLAANAFINVTIKFFGWTYPN